MSVSGQREGACVYVCVRREARAASGVRGVGACQMETAGPTAHCLTILTVSLSVYQRLLLRSVGLSADSTCCYTLPTLLSIGFSGIRKKLIRAK